MPSECRRYLYKVQCFTLISLLSSTVSSRNSLKSLLNNNARDLNAPSRYYTVILVAFIPPSLLKWKFCEQWILIIIRERICVILSIHIKMLIKLRDSFIYVKTAFLLDLNCCLNLIWFKLNKFLIWTYIIFYFFYDHCTIDSRRTLLNEFKQYSEMLMFSTW